MHTATLMAIPGVVGTASGEQAGKPCILVFVSRKSTGLLRKIPARLDGYPVRVDEIGDIRPLK